MTWLIVVLAVVVLLGVLVAVAFNKLRRADVRAEEALGGIDVQLTRRADLVPSLVETVKGYARHETALFEQVTAARTAATTAARTGSVAEKAAAEVALDRSLVQVVAVAEAYPDLKASASFVSLQQQLADTENQLAFARQYYNDAAATVNTLVATVPWMFVAGMAGVRRRTFYEAAPGQAAPPTVSF